MTDVDALIRLVERLDAGEPLRIHPAPASPAVALPEERKVN